MRDARQLGLILCSQEHDTPTGNDLFPVRQSLLRQGLLDHYVLLAPAPQGQKDVVGLVVAVNGQVVSAEVYGSSRLFGKLWPKLLKSYALDALGHGDSDADKTCDTATAVDFLRQASEAKIANQGEKAGVSLTHRENDKLACFTVSKPVVVFTDATRQGEPAAAKAAPPAPIHLNALEVIVASRLACRQPNLRRTRAACPTDVQRDGLSDWLSTR